MSNRNELYDPPANHSENHDASTDRVRHLKQEISDVTAVMNHNLQLSSERGANLDSLQNQSEGLSQNARGFNRRANQLRKDMWWKDMRMRICIIVGIIVLLIVIIVPSVVVGKGK